MTTEDARFIALVERYHDDRCRRKPTAATALGRHEFDAQLESFSLTDARVEAAELRRFSEALEAFGPQQLASELAADRLWLLAINDGRLQELEEFRPLETDPDCYSGGITDAAFSLINRDFAACETRARSLLSRLALMPAVLKLARTNLVGASRAKTDIAIAQLPGNIAFFRETLPLAFPTLTDAALLAELAAACEHVAEALEAYQSFLLDEVAPKAPLNFAIGAASYRRKLFADDMIDLSLETLLAIGEKDLARNQQALRDAAQRVDPEASLAAVLERLASTHVPADELLTTTQALLPELIAFIEARDLLTLPPGPPLCVVETPSFLRATVTAAMDAPGPYEAKGALAYYYMTLPNPSWPLAEQEAYMGQWNSRLIANLSAHEAYPGHYVQFLLLQTYPTLSRKILWSPTNVEGWAHYCEQLMVEEGFHADDPWYEVAQLQDALLRNARVIVGLKMHTADMTVEQATAFFQAEAWLSAPVARSEAWRGATDPTYGYYTLGKLLLLELREDVRRERGKAFSLKAFHDEFLRLGPIPISLARKAMLANA